MQEQLMVKYAVMADLVQSHWAQAVSTTTDEH